MAESEPQAPLSAADIHKYCENMIGVKSNDPGSIVYLRKLISGEVDKFVTEAMRQKKDEVIIPLDSLIVQERKASQRSWEVASPMERLKFVLYDLSKRMTPPGMGVSSMRLARQRLEELGFKTVLEGEDHRGAIVLAYFPGLQP